ncbi:PREDICTED: transforming growth factor beta receptor type 3-like [Branchiostoma belcheri]|uniref:Transforming growth factor beta receptor type 3-like n=1 Tax=Branchiostoma belcheri TaxID=7741 RepID=A0A6P5AAI3_BRABE|nr:PREDICTED: transforming growth factor beta receptor type 3-like [Branchiostoma belcheri]
MFTAQPGNESDHVTAPGVQDGGGRQDSSPIEKGVKERLIGGGTVVLERREIAVGTEASMAVRRGPVMLMPPVTVTNALVMFALLGATVELASGLSCVPKRNFRSPYVTPLYQQLTVSSGCESRATVGHDHEVYVVNLLSGSPAYLAVASTEVALHISARMNRILTGLTEKPLMFVLNSHQPIVWKIKVDGLAPNRQAFFHVTLGSSVTVEGEMIVAVNTEGSMPLQGEALLAWTRRMYHGITSFTELEHANDIYIKVGEDMLSPPRCNITRNFLSPNSYSAYLQPQPAHGCFAMATANQEQEVHVIEVHSANKNPFAKILSSIVVDVQPRDKEKMEQNIVLVLKSHTKGVKWRIMSQNIKGSLHVLANTLVDVSEAGMAPVTSQTVKISAHGQDLIRWVEEDKGYQRIQSYTEVQLSNRLQLQLGSPEASRMVEQGLVGGRTLDGSAPVSRPPLPMSPEELESALYAAMSVRCRERDMEVALAKAVLQPYGITAGQLSLQDADCTAGANITHFILSTTLEGCATSRHMHTKSATFFNTVVLSGMVEVQQEGSGDFGSADGPDAEDMEVEVPSVTANFECDYPAVGLTEDNMDSSILEAVPTAGSDDPVSFHMEIYKTSLYMRPEAEFPMVKETDERIFVDIQVATDEGLALKVEHCYMSDSSLQDSPPLYNLIEDGCPVTSNSVQYLAITPLDTDSMSSQKKQRFSFLPKNTVMPFVFLHCQLTVCSEGDSSVPDDIEQCVDLNDFCLRKQASGQHRAAKSSVYSQHRFVGPFIISGSVGTEEPDHKGKAEESKINSRQEGPQIVIQGLEAGTVVGIAFAAFVIGIALTATLWYIHTHTGPKRQKSDPNSSPVPPRHPIPHRPLPNRLPVYDCNSYHTQNGRKPEPGSTSV